MGNALQGIGDVIVNTVGCVFTLFGAIFDLDFEYIFRLYFFSCLVGGVQCDGRSRAATIVASDNPELNTPTINCGDQELFIFGPVDLIVLQGNCERTNNFEAECAASEIVQFCCVQSDGLRVRSAYGTVIPSTDWTNRETLSGSCTDDPDSDGLAAVCAGFGTVYYKF